MKTSEGSDRSDTQLYKFTSCKLTQGVTLLTCAVTGDLVRISEVGTPSLVKDFPIPPSPFEPIPHWQFKTDQARLISNTFKFIIHLIISHSTLCNILYCRKYSVIRWKVFKNKIYIIIIITTNCNWVFTRWQYPYTSKDKTNKNKYT
jgi:hypothetical protein